MKKGSPVPLVIHLSIILHSVVFPMWQCTPTISKFAIQMECLCTIFTFSVTSREPLPSTREFSTAKGMTVKTLPTR